jgi:hypothetical protein
MLPIRRVRRERSLKNAEGQEISDKLRSRFSPMQPASSLIKIAQGWGGRELDWGALTEGLWPVFS